MRGTRVLESSLLCRYSWSAFLGLGHGRGRAPCLGLVQLNGCCRTGRCEGGLGRGRDLSNVVDEGHRVRYQVSDILSGGFPVQLWA